MALCEGWVTVRLTKIRKQIYHVVAKTRNQSVICPVFRTTLEPTSPTRRFHAGPGYGPLNVSNDAEEYLDQPQIRSVPSRPAIYYGEDPFSPPSSDDEDDYAKEVDNDPNSIIRFEIGNGDDEEELLVCGHRHPVR